MFENDQLLTANEAAKLLRVSVSTLKAMDPELKPFIVGRRSRRYTLEMLKRYLERSRKGDSHDS